MQTLTRFHSLALPILTLLSVTSSGCKSAPTCDAGPELCLGDTGTESGDETGSGTGGSDQEQLDVNRDVDVLFVIDNSGSMGEEQANLAANIPAFIEVLEQEQVRANYRIGVTTTDNGNPWCPVGSTTPEAGRLILSSCKSRLEDFLFNNGDVNVQDLACNDICSLTDAELQIIPTTTDFDSNAVARPWLENNLGQKNIPETTSIVDAFRCFGPQGINGCGFESQLESMYLALKRAENVDEESYGFVRAQAVLAIVFLTDETDCSYNKDYSEIFEQDGNKVFWSDPAASFPTSAVCWNAGVSCTGDPSSYDTCDPVNKDVDGNEGVSDAEAVLHPMSRYFGLLDGLEAQKQDYNANQELIVGLIGGVSVDGSVHYGSVGGTDPEYQNNFGIGPGCTAPPPMGSTDPVTAVPPVRERDLVNRYSEGNMFSICESDYSPALEQLANDIADHLRPACYSRCAQDLDPNTATLEPECTVEEQQPGNNEIVVVDECMREGGAYTIDLLTGGYTMPSDNVNVCHAMRIDATQSTPSTADDMSSECSDLNYNLEFVIERRPGFPAAGGTSITATCLLADSPDDTCPGIGL
jgi:hypothetical protein